MKRLKGILLVLFSVFFLACPNNRNNQKIETKEKMFSVNFSVENDLGGEVTAELEDGSALTNGSKQKEGTIVVFKAIPNEFYEFEKWNITEEKTERIEITLKENINLIATFKMKKDKPPLKSNEVKIFQINGIGRDSIRASTFNPDFESHVEDGTNPLFLFDGDVLNIKIGCWKGTNGHPIKDVLFKLDDEKPITIATTKDSTSSVVIEKYSSIWEKTLKDEIEHNMHIEIHPAITQYSPLTYKFRVKK